MIVEAQVTINGSKAAIWAAVTNIFVFTSNSSDISLYLNTPGG